jgi:hypothetical protein
VQFGQMTCSREAHSLQVFGYDFLIKIDNETYSPVLLEVNASPQFNDSKELADLKVSVSESLINGMANIVIQSFSRRREFPSSVGWNFCGDVKLFD